MASIATGKQSAKHGGPLVPNGLILRLIPAAWLALVWLAVVFGNWSPADAQVEEPKRFDLRIENDRLSGRSQGHPCSAWRRGRDQLVGQSPYGAASAWLRHRDVVEVESRKPCRSRRAPPAASRSRRMAGTAQCCDLSRSASAVVVDDRSETLCDRGGSLLLPRRCSWHRGARAGATLRPTASARIFFGRRRCGGRRVLRVLGLFWRQSTARGSTAPIGRGCKARSPRSSSTSARPSASAAVADRMRGAVR